jgi:hypothetical protein
VVEGVWHKVYFESADRVQWHKNLSLECKLEAHIFENNIIASFGLDFDKNKF